MVDRLEFPDKVKLEIFKRAGGPGDLRCEGCGLPIKGRNFEIDHTIEEWEREDVAHGYREPLKADDGQLLCIPCHDAKTGKKAGERAHVKRIVKKAAKVKSKWSRPIPGSKASPWKRKVGGRMVRRDE